MEEDSDLKPDIVKLENEHILDQNYEGPFRVMIPGMPYPGLEQDPNMQLEKISSDINFTNCFSAATSSIIKEEYLEDTPVTGNKSMADFWESAQVKTEIGDDLTNKSKSAESGAQKVLEKPEPSELRYKLDQPAQSQLLASNVNESHKDTMHASEAGSKTCKDHLKTGGWSTDQAKEPVLLTTIKEEADAVSNNEIEIIVKKEPFEFEENDSWEEDQDPVLDDGQQISPSQVHSTFCQSNVVFSCGEINSETDDNYVESEQEICQEKSRALYVAKVSKKMRLESTSVFKKQSSSGTPFPRIQPGLLKSEVIVGSENDKNSHSKGECNLETSNRVSAPSEQGSQSLELVKNLSNQSGNSHCEEKTYSYARCLAKCKASIRQRVKIHLDGKRSSCNPSSSQFGQKSNLSRNSLIYSGKKVFSCEQCSAEFRKKGCFKRHLQTHSGDKPFSCVKCPAQFCRKSNLTRHLQTHTGEKPFSCEQCRAQFSRKTTLQNHLLTHSGEKPFSCERCRAQFSRESHLKRHLQTHSGEKRFSCEHCQAKFTHKSSLKNHVSIHSGEKPFSCEQCPAQFRQIGHLKRHLRIHTDEKLLLWD